MTLSITLAELSQAVEQYLMKLGFRTEDASLITKNIVEAELCGKTSHGIKRLELLKLFVEKKMINTQAVPPRLISNQTNCYLFDGDRASGYTVMEYSLAHGLSKMAQQKILMTGLTNTGPSTGFFGAYARHAAQNGALFIGFSNSSGGLIPHGTLDPIWGHNPTAIGIPYQSKSIIIDFSASSISWGQLALANQHQTKLKADVALDADGLPTIDPSAALLGGVLPFGGHKGSAIAFFIEIFAGIMTNSMAGKQLKGGWGTMYLLIDPFVFIEKGNFDHKINTFLRELKYSRRSNPEQSIYYPGEQSEERRNHYLLCGAVDVDEIIYNKIL